MSVSIRTVTVLTNTTGRSKRQCGAARVSLLRAMGFILFFLACSACQSVHVERNGDVRQIASEYLRASVTPRDQAASAAVSIKRLNVVQGQGATCCLVSANLSSADLPAVLDRLAAQTGQTIAYAGLPAGSQTTVLFDRLPLADALALLLAGADLRAQPVAGGFRVVEGSQSATASAAGTARVHINVNLKHLRADLAITLLGNMLEGGQPRPAKDGDSDASDREAAALAGLQQPGLSVSALPGRNQLYVSGELQKVLKAAHLLHYADQERPHVVLEALVVEADAFALKNLGLNLVEFAGGDLVSGSFNPSSDLQDTISFALLKGADSPRKLNAIVDMLEMQENAQIIARPYTSTLSHEPARIDITQERYLIVEQRGNTRAAKPVTAGISLHILPTVLGRNNIRIRVDVESSQFAAGPLNSDVLIDKSTANTLVELQSGQTMVIGGLYRHINEADATGVPVLKDIPGLNMLFSSQGRSKREAEVIVYITPRIWRQTDRFSTPDIIRPHINEEEIK